jgi:hypothetical protein
MTMTDSNPTSLSPPTFAGGTKAITLTPIVGTPRRQSFGFSGDTRACWPLVRACEGVDLLIHECFPPAAVPPPDWWAEALIPLD